MNGENKKYGFKIHLEMCLSQGKSFLLLTASMLYCTTSVLVRPQRRMTQEVNAENMQTPTSKYFCQFSPWLCEV